MRQRKGTTLDLSKKVREVELGVAGDSRVRDMAHVDKEGRVGEGSLEMFCEERAWG